MAEKNTREIYYDAHAPVYEDNVFTKNTVREAGVSKKYCF